MRLASIHGCSFAAPYRLEWARMHDSCQTNRLAVVHARGCSRPVRALGVSMAPGRVGLRRAPGPYSACSERGHTRIMPASAPTAFSGGLTADLTVQLADGIKWAPAPLHNGWGCSA